MGTTLQINIKHGTIKENTMGQFFWARPEFKWVKPWFKPGLIKPGFSVV